MSHYPNIIREGLTPYEVISDFADLNLIDCTFLDWIEWAYQITSWKQPRSVAEGNNNELRKDKAWAPYLD